MTQTTPDSRTGRSSTPEQRAILRCARLSDPMRADPCPPDQQNLDWELFTQLARRHGLIPLVHHHVRAGNLNTAPPDAVERFREQFHAIAARNLLLTTHLLELLGEFEKAGIRAIPFKGVVVSEAYYGSLAYRPVADIDLVVEPRQAREAFRLLERLDFVSRSRPRTRLIEFTDHHHVFERRGVAVEIHWKLSPWRFRVPLDFELLWQRTERVLIAGRTVPNLSPEDALILLSAHGAKHQWDRLIWLVDIVQLIDSRPQLQWTLAFERARSLGCERIVLLTLHLCERLLGAQLPVRIADRVAADRQIPFLVEIAERDLFTPNAVPLGRIDDDVFGLSVRERFRDRIRWAWPHRSAATRPTEQFFPFPVRLWRAIAIGFAPPPSREQNRDEASRLRALLRPLQSAGMQGLRLLWRVASIFSRG